MNVHRYTYAGWWMPVCTQQHPAGADEAVTALDTLGLSCPTLELSVPRPGSCLPLSTEISLSCIEWPLRCPPRRHWGSPTAGHLCHRHVPGGTSHQGVGFHAQVFSFRRFGQTISPTGGPACLFLAVHKPPLCAVPSPTGSRHTPSHGPPGGEP